MPKKPSGHTAAGELYFLPEAARPLSIVNTDNRLMAAALKVALHDWMEKWISHHQQGFLTGRSMNDNILQVDFWAKVFALEEEEASLVFFDFKAAFPSLSHDFMWYALQQLGVSDPWFSAIRKFYRSNVQHLGGGVLLCHGGH